jgi:hypothetical protein
MPSAAVTVLLKALTSSNHVHQPLFAYIRDVVCLSQTRSPQRGTRLWQMYRGTITHDVRNGEGDFLLGQVRHRPYVLLPRKRGRLDSSSLGSALESILDEEELLKSEAEVLESEVLKVCFERDTL